MTSWSGEHDLVVWDTDVSLTQEVEGSIIWEADVSVMWEVDSLVMEASIELDLNIEDGLA